MPPKKDTDLYEVVADTWGAGPPVYTKGHILSADSIHPSRDLAWAKQTGVVRRLASDDPRRKAGPSDEPDGMPLMLGDDGWSDPAFPYQAPVTRAESEEFAASVVAAESGSVASVAEGVAADAQAAADTAETAAENAKKRAETAAKAMASAQKATAKGDQPDPSAADIQAGQAPPPTTP